MWRNRIFGIRGKRSNIKNKLSSGNNGMSRKVLDMINGNIFDTMNDALKYFNIKKHQTLKNIV